MPAGIYDIKRKISSGTRSWEGGFGITYLAEDLVEEQAVAIKEYFPMGLVSRNVKETGKEEVSVLGGEQGEYYRSGLKKFLEEAYNLENFGNGRELSQPEIFSRPMERHIWSWIISRGRV